LREEGEGKGRSEEEGEGRGKGKKTKGRKLGEYVYEGRQEGMRARELGWRRRNGKEGKAGGGGVGEDQ